jgi:hypothetical protein
MIDIRDRATSDAQQDAWENCPFACVGGLSARTKMQVPSYIPEADRLRISRATEATERQRAACTATTGRRALGGGLR